MGLFVLIFLIFRRRKFLKLTLVELPKLSSSELENMKRCSNTALTAGFWLSVASFVPYVLGASAAISASTANACSMGLAVLAFVVAAFFDSKAEQIRRRGK